MAISEQEKQYVESIKSQQEQDSENTVLERLTKDEREIILIYNEGEGYWTAETSIPKYWRRLEKKNWICTDTQYYSDGSVCCKTFKGGKKGITITDPFKVRELTDEQRQKIRDRFTKGNQEENDDAAE